MWLTIRIRMITEDFPHNISIHHNNKWVLWVSVQARGAFRSCWAGKNRLAFPEDRGQDRATETGERELRNVTRSGRVIIIYLSPLTNKRALLVSREVESIDSLLRAFKALHLFFFFFFFYIYSRRYVCFLFVFFIRKAFMTCRNGFCQSWSLVCILFFK